MSLEEVTVAIQRSSGASYWINRYGIVAYVKKKSANFDPVDGKMAPDFCPHGSRHAMPLYFKQLGFTEINLFTFILVRQRQLISIVSEWHRLKRSSVCLLSHWNIGMRLYEFNYV